MISGGGVALYYLHRFNAVRAAAATCSAIVLAQRVHEILQTIHRGQIQNGIGEPHQMMNPVSGCIGLCSFHGRYESC